MTKLEPHQVKCMHCGTIFDALRADARYCSVNCRVAAHTARHKPDKPTSVKPNAEVEKLRRELAAARAELAKLTASKPTTSAPLNEAAIQERIDEAVYEACSQWIQFGKLLEDAAETAMDFDAKRMRAVLDKVGAPTTRAMAFVAQRWAWARYQEFVRDRFPKEKAALDEELAKAKEEKELYERLLRKRIESDMTADEFKLVLGCLHPDRPNIDAARLNRAFEIFNRLKYRFSRR